MDIFLWGPQGAGKTWLVNALIRQINLMESDLRNNYPLFDVWIDDIMGHRVTVSELEPKATTDIDYVSYTLRRRYNPDNNNQETIKIACTHNHQISMLDGPGDAVTGELLNDPNANTEENRAKVLSAHTRLRSAKYLIITINGGNIRGSVNNLSTVGKVFSENLQKLINLNRVPDQKVYLCFTKVDQNQGTAATLESMLRLLFGSSADRIESQLRELLRIRQGVIPAYFISATGYYYDNNAILTPNFANGVLADASKWQPFNIHKPFFDIFDDAEKESIKNMHLKPLINNFWLLPKNLQNKINLKLHEARKKDILDAHLSYHQMIDHN